MTARTLAQPPRGHRLSVRGATKRFGTVPALSSVDVDAEPGQFLVLLGPSGSGKSTLVRCLAGVERLDAGQISLSGQLVGDGRRHLPPERRDLAMVFQDYALWPHLSVAENVGYALRRRQLSPSEHRRRVGATIERVGLTHHAGRYPGELSGGEQQRVALARAIVAEPGLLLFDEPLSNLDADLRERLRVEISTLTRETGATAVYITHDQSEAFALADRIGVLDHGRLVQLDRPEQIYHQPATAFVARFTGAAGELPGRTFGASDGALVRVQVGAANLLARPIGVLGREASVRVLVRPAATSIAEGAAAAPDAGMLRGVVADVAYRGRGYDHVVEVQAGTLSAVHSPRAYPRGESIDVLLDPQGCLAFAIEKERDTLDLTTVRVGSGGSSVQLAGRPSARE